MPFVSSFECAADHGAPLDLHLRLLQSEADCDLLRKITNDAISSLELAQAEASANLVRAQKAEGEVKRCETALKDMRASYDRQMAHLTLKLNRSIFESDLRAKLASEAVRAERSPVSRLNLVVDERPLNNSYPK